MTITTAEIKAYRTYITGQTEAFAEVEDWGKIDSYSMAWIELILPANLLIV